MLAAVVRALEEEEADERGKKDDRRRRRGEDREAGRLDGAPTGLGIVGLGLRPRVPEEEELPPPAAPAVVVNVGAAAAPGDKELARLTAYVVKGSEFDRPGRLRTAVDVLKASTDSEEERLTLAAQLDAAVAAALEGPKEQPRTRRAAGVAFDMIKDFLG